MAAPEEIRLRTPDGVDLAVYRYGGSGRPVLLGHPTGFNGRVWDPVAAALVGRGHAVWSYDHRGHGHSERGPSPEWSGYATDLLAVVDHLELDPDALIGAGLSMGGAAWILAVARRPRLARALWLYEPIVFPPEIVLPPDQEVPLAPMARKRRNAWESPQVALESYRSRPPMQPFHPDALAGYVAAGLHEDANGVWRLTCDPMVESDSYNHGMHTGAWDLLPLVEPSTVVVSGSRSDALQPAWVRRLADRLPHGQHVVWDGAGHFGPLVDPDRAAAEIAALSSS